jgi:hypothetical protein
MTLPTHSGPWPLIQFGNHFLQTVGLLGLAISPSQGRYLNTRQHKHRINAYTHQTSMPWTGFEPTIPASERAKTVHVLDRAATVTGMFVCVCVCTSVRLGDTQWSRVGYAAKSIHVLLFYLGTDWRKVIDFSPSRSLSFWKNPLSQVSGSENRSGLSSCHKETNVTIYNC